MRRLLVLALGLSGLHAGCMPPSWAANALLHPPRRPVTAPSPPFEELRFEVGIPLAGWRSRTDRPRRGTLVYLHGVGDNRDSGKWIADHFTRRGFDVLAYDSRAHGASGGDACTYGYFEKTDLRR